MALLLGMAMLPAGAIAMHLGLSAIDVRRSSYEDSLTRRAEQALETERGVINEVRELLRVMATAPPLQNLESRACRAWLEDIAAVGSSRVDLQACKLEYSIVSPK